MWVKNIQTAGYNGARTVVYSPELVKPVNNPWRANLYVSTYLETLESHKCRTFIHLQMSAWRHFLISFFQKRMVFCYQNCSDLLWEKIVLVIEKTFEILGWRLRICIFLRSQEKFIWTVKGQNNFWNRMLFQLISGGFSDLIH